MKRIALFLLLALPVAAQDRFSITAGRYAADFSTDVRVDPLGTTLNLERDLFLDRSRKVNDFSARWRVFARHELAASYVSASRNGLGPITQEIRFNGRFYPVSGHSPEDPIHQADIDRRYVEWFGQYLK